MNETSLKLMTLHDAAKSYLVYLAALKMHPRDRMAQARSLRYILEFYGPAFPLTEFDGERVLQYADIFSPYDDDPYNKERGFIFWLFVHWMKKNEMIPSWTAPKK